MLNRNGIVMKYPVLLCVLLLTACGSTKVTKIDGYEGPKAMARYEVIQANKECMNARLRPNVEYLPQKYPSGTIMVPVNVHCEAVYGR
jgi:hypothetical protein